MLTENLEALLRKIAVCAKVNDKGGGNKAHKQVLAMFKAAAAAPANLAAPQKCTEERPCIPCYTDNGTCVKDNASDAPAQSGEAVATVFRGIADAQEHGLIEWTGDVLPPGTQLYTTPQPSQPAQAGDSDEDLPVEVWHGERKVTIYKDVVIRVWGENIATEMSDEPRTLQSVQDALDWLYEKPPAVVLDDERAALEIAYRAYCGQSRSVQLDNHESMALDFEAGWVARAAFPQAEKK